MTLNSDFIIFVRKQYL